MGKTVSWQIARADKKGGGFNRPIKPKSVFISEGGLIDCISTIYLTPEDTFNQEYQYFKQFSPGL